MTVSTDAYGCEVHNESLPLNGFPSSPPSPFFPLSPLPMTISRSSFNNPVSNHPHHQTSYPPEPDEDPEGATLLLHQKHTGTEDGHENEDNMQVKEAGVARIEALYSVFGGTHGAPIWILYASIGLIAYVYSLDSNTTPSFLPFATSAFKAHSLLGTINVTNTIISAVAQPLIAKFADVTSRPRAYVLALVFVSCFCSLGSGKKKKFCVAYLIPGVLVPHRLYHHRYFPQRAVRRNRRTLRASLLPSSLLP
jgi:hypothetical protein